jgi:gamma-glutamyltranspeptidase/glutathione hydrolase
METPVFNAAAVAAPHAAACEAGLAILREGGNALEATIAVAATIAVVYPHMNGIGGDNFWVIREPSGKVRSIEACGFAGEHATIDRYRAMELSSIPLRGPPATLTVPGAIGGWQMAHEMAKANGGRLPLDMLLHHATVAARDGSVVGKSEARYIIKDDKALFDLPFFKETYFTDDRQPAAGSTRRFPALAATLQHLTDAGLDDFYRGDVGREMAADLAKAGTPITRADLKNFRAAERQPLSARIGDCMIHMPQPPSQGIAALMMLGIFEELGVKRGDSIEHLHGMIESVKRANTLRDRLVTEFDRIPEDLAPYLTQDRFSKEALQIDAGRAAPWPLPRMEDGDTIWCGAIDSNGMVVSLIQSLFWEYGSGVVLPRTGVLMQNRGLGLSLDPGSINALRPGRRPFHTLHAPLAVFDDGRIMSYGSMGGEVQPQITSSNFLRYARFGQSVSAALDAPRFTFGKSWNAKRPTVKMESRFDPALVSALEKRGHEVEVNPNPYADSFGHAGMLVKHTDGSVMADHDPRADGGAMGL